MSTATTLGGNLGIVPPLVGRDDAIAEVGELVSAHRLVTLTGAGGSGKTSLALSAAAALAERFEAGVWLCPLDTTSTDLVASTVAASLGVVERPGEPIAGSLLDALEDSERLLILDGCEHVVGAAADLTRQLLERSESLRVVATSRESLGIAGEHTYRVQPLSLRPDEDGETSAADELFLERSKAANPVGAFDARDLEAVSRICRRVEGLPLAIELAASKTSLLPVPEIADRLESDLNLLSTGRRRPSRQATLHDAIDWSYRLLDDAEQALFRSLAVFNGSADLGAIHHVSQVADDDMVTLNLLDSLVRKSMVVAQPDQGRFRLLEPLREFGVLLLDEEGEAATFHERHARWYLDRAERINRQRDVPINVRLNEHLVEMDNARKAMDWLASVGDDAANLRFIGELYEVWAAGLAEETNMRFEAALDPSRDLTDLDRSIGLGKAAYTYGFLGQHERSEELAEESLATSERAGVPASAHAHVALAWSAVSRGQVTPVLEHTEAAYEIGMAQDSPVVEHALNIRCAALALAGRVDEGFEVLDELRGMADPDEDAYAATVSAYLEGMLVADDDPERSVELLQQALELAGEAGMFPTLVNWVWANLGRSQLAAGHPVEAAEAFARSIALQRESGHLAALSAAATGLAVALAQAGHDELATDLFAWIDTEGPAEPTLDELLDRVSALSHDG